MSRRPANWTERYGWSKAAAAPQRSTGMTLFQRWVADTAIRYKTALNAAGIPKDEPGVVATNVAFYEWLHTLQPDRETPSAFAGLDAQVSGVLADRGLA